MDEVQNTALVFSSLSERFLVHVKILIFLFFQIKIEHITKAEVPMAGPFANCVFIADSAPWPKATTTDNPETRKLYDVKFGGPAERVDCAREFNCFFFLLLDTSNEIPTI